MYMIITYITPLLVTFWCGLCLGSFIHTAIYRFFPTQTAQDYIYEIALSRSQCPNCHKNLSSLSLIPVFSWLKQHGCCQYCQRAIPIHYPITELIVAMYCLTITVVYGVTVWSLILILLGLYFILLIIIDFKYLLLPNYFTYPLLLMGIIFAYYKVGLVSFDEAVFGTLLGYSVLWLPATLYYLLKRQIGLGGGDIKLSAALGAWLPVTELPTLLFFASIIGIGYFFVYYVTQKPLERKILVPFGSCLLISAYPLLLLLST